MKMVCKQSEVMHARFSGSSWEKQNSMKSQSDHKASPMNKAGKRFRTKVEKLSVAQDWSSIKRVGVVIKFLLNLFVKQKEWVVVKQLQMDAKREQCLCGRPNLKFATILKNTINNNQITAGNCCILTLGR